MKILYLTSLSLLALFLSSCSNRAEIILLPENGKVGQIVVTEDGNEVVLDQAWQKVDIQNIEKKETLAKEDVENRYSSLLESMPKTLSNYRLYFKFDSSDLTNKSYATLKTIVKEIKSNNVLQIDVIGYTDRAGEKKYNEVLSMKRAEAVSKLLQSKGIDKEKIYIFYYGEANPIVKTADNVPLRKNRRVEVTIK